MGFPGAAAETLQLFPALAPSDSLLDSPLYPTPRDASAGGAPEAQRAGRGRAQRGRRLLRAVP